MEEIKIEEKYKDRLFKLVFDRKEDLLSLYNAVNGTHYCNPEDITVNTIKECIYMSMKNDVSFLLCDVMNLYEHQSSDNPNMPLRGLFYLSMLYRGLFGKHKDLYSSRLISLPTPQFVVFYNGNTNEPDERIMKLSDAYVGKVSGTPALECTVRLLNINYGHNRDIMEKCEKLRGYSLLIKRVKDNFKAGMGREEAVVAAVDSCIEEGILVDILLRHKAEVTSMILAEYDEVLHINNEKNISFEDGKAEGHAEGLAEGLARGEAQRQNMAEEIARLKREVEELRNRPE